MDRVWEGRGERTTDEVCGSAPGKKEESANPATRSRPGQPSSSNRHRYRKTATGRPHPGTPSSGGREWRGSGGAFLAGRLWRLSPPRGQVRPSRDAPRPGRSTCNVSLGRETAAVEFAARVGDPSLLARVYLYCWCLSPSGLPQASTCRTTTW